MTKESGFAQILNEMSKHAIKSRAVRLTDRRKMNVV